MLGTPLPAPVCNIVLVAPTNGGWGWRDHLSAPSPSGKITMTYLFTLPVTIALFMCGLLFSVNPQPGHGQIMALSAAITACVAAVLFAPQRQSTQLTWFKATLIDAAVVTVIFVITVLATQGDVMQMLPLARAVVTCFLLVVLGISILAMTAGKAETNRQFVTVILVAIVAAPIWLAPLAEFSGNSRWLSDGIVAVSPLSAFAVALDLDILRTGWFYEHSVLGSMRYNYPAWGAYFGVLSTLAILSIILTIQLQIKRAKK
jgi:hypothetical protein